MNLNYFDQKNLPKAVNTLLQELNIPFKPTINATFAPEEFLNQQYQSDRQSHQYLQQIHLIGMIEDESFQNPLFNTTTKDLKEIQNNSDYQAILIVAAALQIPQDKLPNKTQLTEIARAINLSFKNRIPIIIIFRYRDYITLAHAKRTNYKQKAKEHEEKIGTITLLKDINIKKTHAGHLQILNELPRKNHITTYRELYQHWQNTINVNLLNKRFYQQLFQWYQNAVQKVYFPQINLPQNQQTSTQNHNAISVIRLLTRLIFVWFLKEKQLIDTQLFDTQQLNKQLKDFDPQSNQQYNYYQAILQNLFFATLNTHRNIDLQQQNPNNTNQTPIQNRQFIDNTQQYQNDQYLDQTKYRYQELFNNPQTALQLFQDVPFLNGGLFESLDKKTTDNKEIRIDGFSSKKHKQAKVPNSLFFHPTEGIINILNQYKFTIEENTPLEEDVALDPELLGNIFENLLAEFSEETQTSKRKATGSFYTPKEIVAYMTQQTLQQYLKQQIPNTTNQQLQQLFDTTQHNNPFDQNTTQQLIEAIANCKILDPACGSGAFPMGILQQMTQLLQKLDPDNQQWKQIQRQKIIGEKERQLKNDQQQIQKINDQEIRQKAEALVQERLQEIEQLFDKQYHFDDYARKLFLIENCIYGTDIQPIAIQIAKLRFFISLIIEQQPNPTLPNKGIKPLPNLEVKFVAANSLIPLPNNNNNTLKAITIIQTEQQLDQLREQIFYTHQYYQKKQLIENEKQTRTILQKQLTDNGFDHKTAQLKTQWNPFDHTSIAPFFDPQTMFNIQNGFDIIIGNPPYIQLQKDGGKLAKQFQNQQYTTFERMGDIYALFYERGIQLLKNNAHLCYITSNKWMRAGYGKSLRTLFTKHNPTLLVDLGADVFENATVDTNILLIQKTNQTPTKYDCQALDLSKEKNFNGFEQYNKQYQQLTHFSNETWTIATPIQQQIKDKIIQYGKPLKEWNIQIYRGITTGCNEAFIIDTPTKQQLCIQDPQSTDIIKPILRGRDIKRYEANWAEQWIITTFPAKKINIAQYPAVKAYLQSFGKKLHQTGEEFINATGQKEKSRKKTNNKWFETQDQIGYFADFQKEKIVWQRVTAEPTFCLSEPGQFVLDSMAFIIAGQYTKYLLAFLNSKLIFFYTNQVVHQYGSTGFRLSNQYVENFPIPQIPIEAQLPLIDLVEQILLAKQQNRSTAALESAIDQHVYALYYLTPQEIQHIEAAQKQTTNNHPPTAATTEEEDQ